MVDAPGVVTGRYGTIGLIHYVCEPFWPLNTTLYVQDFKGNDPRFVYYLLKTISYRDYLDKAAVPGINRNDVHRAKVCLPPISEQKSIAQTMLCLDERMESLHEQNETLEATARAIFKSWFVDFDPVRAKAEGRDPEGMDANTAALFPSAFEDSELGTMPYVWKCGCISDLCETLTNGGTPSRSKPELWQNGSIQWFKTGELKDGFLLNSDELISEEAVRCSSTKMLPRHAVLVALYGATIGRLGILTSASTFNQACTGMVARQDVGPWYLFLFLRNAYEALRNLGNGAAQQNISKAIVERFPVPVPCPSILAAFNGTVEPLFLKIESNSQMQQNLTTLRDTLLPRLISGKLRVPEAEAMLKGGLHEV
jgi:type I restriction enzyme S subunit